MFFDVPLKPQSQRPTITPPCILQVPPSCSHPVSEALRHPLACHGPMYSTPDFPRLR